MKDYLFLPLKKEFFDCFKDGSKTYELRGISNIFNEKSIYIGRKVILSIGYNKKNSINGIIEDVKFYNNLQEIKNDNILNNILPLKICFPEYEHEDVCNFIKFYFNKYNKFICFKIKILKRIEKYDSNIRINKKRKRKCE